MNSKICKACGQTKLLSEFSPHKECKLKVKPRCKDCEAKIIKQIYWRNPQKKIIAVRKWLEKNANKRNTVKSN